MRAAPRRDAECTCSLLHRLAGVATTGRLLLRTQPAWNIRPVPLLVEGNLAAAMVEVSGRPVSRRRSRPAGRSLVSMLVDRDLLEEEGGRLVRLQQAQLLSQTLTENGARADDVDARVLPRG